MGTYLMENITILNDTILNDTILNDTILNDSFLSFNCQDDLVTIQVLLIIIICIFTCFLLLLFCAKIEDCYYRIKYNSNTEQGKNDRDKSAREINLQLPQPPQGEIIV